MKNLRECGKKGFDLERKMCYTIILEYFDVKSIAVSDGGVGMVILGIDPGLAIVGWGVIEYAGTKFRVLGYGSIETPAGTETPERLQTIYHDLREIIERYRPDEMAIEELFFDKNITTGIRVAEARGVLLLAAREMGVRLFEYTPMQVKQSVCGYGKAEKKQIIMMVTSILRLKAPPKPDDTADALAIAICHAHTGGSRLAGYYNQQSSF